VVFSDVYQHIGCRHFVAVETFINLCGFMPMEVTFFRNVLDVPFVMPIFVPDDVPAIAVIHSLPICRIEKLAFVPRYSVFMVTYYSLQPKLLWARRRAEAMAEKIKNSDPDLRAPAMYASWQAERQPEMFDLRLWVERGKLKWLDPNLPDLPLADGPVNSFPYAGVEGYRRPYTFRKGRLHLDY
jgi:hypothetical protein